MDLPEGDEVASVCLDEFGRQLYVFTVKHTLLVYKYATNPENPTSGLSLVM